MSTINKIIVTGRLYRELEPLLRARQDKSFRFIAETEVSQKDYEWADAFVGFKPAAHFQLHGIRWVHALGAGVDAFLSHPAWKPDVLLTRTIAAFGQQLSEYCLSYILADAQFHRKFGEQQASQCWYPLVPKPLSAQRAVIFGTGTIGQEIARKLAFFGMHVSGVSRGGEQKPHFAQLAALPGSGPLLESADWVINTLPLTPGTTRLFNEAYFSRMNGCGFMNVGRGGSVCHEALLQAMDRGYVRHAVLDVFGEEPLPARSPLWHRPGVVITPHISAVTEPGEAARDFLKVLEGLDRGQPPVEHLVHLERGY